MVDAAVYRTGGTAPHTRNISNALVATIDPDSGLLQTFQRQGTTIVIATDSAGNAGESGIMPVMK